jgi:DNA-binding GntR family transcriptional regulator
MADRTRPAPRERQFGRSAHGQLRDLIIRGRLAPGARLIEQDLAALLGISRTPVREAMMRLAQEGFARPVRTSARTQLVVAPLTPHDLQDLYTIMGALEGAAVRTLRHMAPARRRAFASDLDKANRVFERIGKTRPSDFERLFDTHNRFHALLVERCATARLRQIIDQVRPHVHRYEYLYAGAVGPDYSDTFAEHRAIMKAVRAGAAADAERAVRANWLNGARRLSAAASMLPSLGNLSDGPD